MVANLLVWCTETVIVSCPKINHVIRINVFSKSNINRLFNPKYPYEYLDSDGDTVMAEQADRIEAFYRERGLLE